MPTDLPETVRPKILVADDEPNWLRVLSLYLRGRHWDVTTALDGHEAIEKIQSDKPDLIIADITMPGMDGYELCRRLRRDAATRTIPFIFLTAHDQEAEQLKARRIGADEYLTKPCSLDRVVQSVATAMERIEQARRMSLEQLGTSGRLDDIDILDLVQTLELEQRTGALILSHGERTGTMYFKDGAIVQADIRSPAREEPLFRLLGWKSGRFLFIPDAQPEDMPITASMAHLLFQDLRLLEEHERHVPSPSAEIQSRTGSRSVSGVEPIGRIFNLLEAVGHRYAAISAGHALPLILRILVVGTAAAKTAELIDALVDDVSGAKWAAREHTEPPWPSAAEIGRVRLSERLALHLVAMRGEQRFWPVWEKYLPESIGSIFLLSTPSEQEQAGFRSFFIARALMAPTMPVVVSVPPALAASVEGTDFYMAEDTAHFVTGSPTEQSTRLSVLSQLLESWLIRHAQ